MARSGERDERVVEGLGDETVAMPPDALVDPDATVAADPDATRPADPDATVAADAAATQLADAAPTRLLDDALPTIVVPGDERGAADQPDGLDAMDDPYYAPASVDELTSARTPVPISSPVQSLPERRPRMPRWAAALIVVVLLACGAGVAYYTYDQELWGGRTVPAVVGMAWEDARRELEDLGFAVEVEAVAVDEGAGVVLSCDPEPGTRADPAAGAVLSVAADRLVPEVVGLSEAEARDALAAVGAQNIQTVFSGSSEPAGTVIAVSPDEGQPFSSQDQVTLSVARAFTVPDVLGMGIDEAMAALAGDGLAGTVAYVDDASRAGTVVDTSPAVGSEVPEGSSVELRVGADFPDEPYDLMAYLDLAPEAVASYLGASGFSLQFGEVFAASGNAHAAYSGPSADVIQISDYPESGRYEGGSRADVLAGGSGVGGARYAFSEETLPAGGSIVSEEGVRAVMRACGFDGLLDVCTQDDVQLPESSDAPEDGSESPSPSFICGYGSQGDRVWAVVIGGYEGSESVVALVAPASHFDDVDLSSHGGSICDYIAYADLYAE